MFSLRDCATLCGLDEGQIAAVCEHARVPSAEAGAIADHLLHQPAADEEIPKVFVELVRNAVRERRLRHAAELLCAFRHFLNTSALGEAA